MKSKIKVTCVRELRHIKTYYKNYPSFAFKLIHYCQITNMYLNKRQLHGVACEIPVLILSLFDSFSISCLFQICLFAKMLSRIGRKACYLCFIWAIFDLYNETYRETHYFRQLVQVHILYVILNMCLPMSHAIASQSTILARYRNILSEILFDRER